MKRASKDEIIVKYIAKRIALGAVANISSNSFVNNVSDIMDVNVTYERVQLKSCMRCNHYVESYDRKCETI